MATILESKFKLTKGWNFGSSLHPLTLDQFLERKSLNFKFFDGSEPWVGDHDRITWENFFRFCTEEMDDLSRLTCGMVIDYCLSVVEKSIAKVKRPLTKTKVQDALAAAYEEAYENPVFQYRWAMRHPVVSEAVTIALKIRTDEE
jgi:hypothetical protein